MTDMARSNFNRRKFLKDYAVTVTGLGLLSALPDKVLALEKYTFENSNDLPPKQFDNPRIKFSVIGINHAHINSQVDAVTRGGGQLVSVYAKEPDLVTAFVKRYPQVKLAASEKEILEDKTIQLILSAAITVDRAGI